MEHDIGHSDTFVHIICANGSQRYREYLSTGELVPALNYWSKIALFSLSLPHIGINSSSKPLLHRAIYNLLRLDSISFVFVFILHNQQPRTISSTMVLLFLNLHTVAIKLITPKKKKKKKKVQSVRRRPPGIFKEVSRNGEKAYWSELQ